MQELQQRYMRIIETHRGTAAGERRIKMAAELVNGAERGEVSEAHAVQMMRRLHGSAEVE